MVNPKQGLPSWIGAAASRVDFEGNVSSSMSQSAYRSDQQGFSKSPNSYSDTQLSFGERSLSAAGAAFISAIIVNPLDVAKVFAYIKIASSSSF